MSWQAAGTSVRGAQHQRLNLPAQDALAWRALPGAVTLAVADGHGSAPSARSDVGATLAVTAATDLLAEWSASPAGAVNGTALARELVERWRAAVRAHRAQHPDGAPRDEADLLVCYGTTVLAALATEHELWLLQLGDGDLLLVSEAGHVRRAFPRDHRLLGGATTSLCMPEAWRELRFARLALDDAAPALVLLCTDGYSNAFRTERGFLRVGRDILAMVRAHGIRHVERDLATWLEEASRLGSGDDVTAGLLYRATAETGAI